MEFNQVFLIGSGAIENAWEPVKRALKKFDPNYNEQFETANFLMAKMVFQHQKLGKMYCEEKNEVSNYNQKRIAEEFNAIEIQLTEFKKLLSAELKICSEEGITKLDLSVLDKITRSNTEAIITTNWTTQELKVMNIENIISLHGNIDEPNFLYLPHASSDDRYAADRPNKLGAFHINSYNLLIEADSIVIWGLGFNPLDCELILLISEVFRYKEKHCKIFIYDKNPFEIKSKLQLLGCGHHTIICHPLNK